MTIKKPLTKPAADAPETAPSPAGGSATIADRFKLDTPPPAKTGGAVGVGTKIAVAAALVALLVAGVLAYTLYGHWEFLKGA